ncbi:flagellar assembly protein FliW [Clostridium sp.]|uniref:flagellar assembly protein FliW n=1 Tax=Clostridium sp. TaxID=1506 RepID=UPI0039927361
MNLETLNYGTISYNEENIVVFEKPLLGFNNLKKFVLVEIEQNSMFNLLQSIEEKAVGFIVLSPFSVRQDYEIELDEATIKELEIESHEDVAIMTTVTLNEVAEKTTTNLKAPIIINIKNKKGKQIILNNDKYKIKEPLMEGK